MSARSQRDAEGLRNTQAAFLSLAAALAFLAGIAQPAPAQAQSTAITGEQVKGNATRAEVESALLEQLAERGQAKALVYLREQADLTPAFGMSWQARVHYVYQQLTATAQRSQARVRQHLNTRSADHQAFWIDNVVVRHADAALVEERRHLPEVRVIRAEPAIFLIDPERTDPADAAATTPRRSGSQPRRNLARTQQSDSTRHRRHARARQQPGPRRRAPGLGPGPYGAGPHRRHHRLRRALHAPGPGQ